MTDHIAFTMTRAATLQSMEGAQQWAFDLMADIEEIGSLAERQRLLRYALQVLQTIARKFNKDDSGM